LSTGVGSHGTTKAFHVTDTPDLLTF